MSFLLALIATACAYEPARDPSFLSTIQRVEQMVWDSNVTSLAAQQGLSVLNVTWEDTGRSKGSSVGPNISDMTIGVRDGNNQLHPMPVIRFDNFNDVSADLSPQDFWLRVGNHQGSQLWNVSLAQLLQNPRAYMSDASSWAGSRRSLWAARDSAVLVSAQACFLPIPRSGEATFTPVLYNYQSSPGNPAVLAITATREGTSMQVVENDGGYLSEALFFNQDGERAPFTAERLSDFKAHGGDGTYGGVSAAGEEGLNMVLLIQVPLKHRQPTYPSFYGYGDAPAMESAAPMPKAASARSDVETAVVGHGDIEGPFREFNHLAIERDPQFPVRVTVQFYKATSNGVVTASDIADIRRQIDRVYKNADYVGSLVTEGFTGRQTEWVNQPYNQPYPHPRPQPQPTEEATWSDSFWNWTKAY